MGFGDRPFHLVAAPDVHAYHRHRAWELRQRRFHFSLTGSKKVWCREGGDKVTDEETIGG